MSPSFSSALQLSQQKSTQSCSVGYEGAACGRCQSDYYDAVGYCLPCSEAPPADFTVRILIAACVICLLSLGICLASPYILTCIVVGFLAVQQIGVVGVIGIRGYSLAHQSVTSSTVDSIVTFYEYLSWTNFDIDLLKPGCHHIPTMTLIDKYYGTLAIMTIVGGVFLVTCCIRFGWKLLMRRLNAKVGVETVSLPSTGADSSVSSSSVIIAQQSSLAPRQDFNARLIQAFFFLATIFYFPLTHLQFRLFHCTEAMMPQSSTSSAPSGNGLFLANDLSIQCFQGDHMIAIIIAVIGLLILTIGFPILTYIHLCRRLLPLTLHVIDLKIRARVSDKSSNATNVSIPDPFIGGVTGWLTHNFRIFHSTERASASSKYAREEDEIESPSSSSSSSNTQPKKLTTAADDATRAERAQRALVNKSQAYLRYLLACESQFGIMFQHHRMEMFMFRTLSLMMLIFTGAFCALVSSFSVRLFLMGLTYIFLSLAVWWWVPGVRSKYNHLGIGIGLLQAAHAAIMAILQEDDLIPCVTLCVLAFLLVFVTLYRKSVVKLFRRLRCLRCLPLACHPPHIPRGSPDAMEVLQRSVDGVNVLTGKSKNEMMKSAKSGKTLRSNKLTSMPTASGTSIARESRRHRSVSHQQRTPQRQPSMTSLSAKLPAFPHDDPPPTTINQMIQPQPLSQSLQERHSRFTYESPSKSHSFSSNTSNRPRRTVSIGSRNESTSNGLPRQVSMTRPFKNEAEQNSTELPPIESASLSLPNIASPTQVIARSPSYAVKPGTTPHYFPVAMAPLTQPSAVSHQSLPPAAGSSSPSGLEVSLLSSSSTAASPSSSSAIPSDSVLATLRRTVILPSLARPPQIPIEARLNGGNSFPTLTATPLPLTAHGDQHGIETQAQSATGNHSVTSASTIAGNHYLYTNSENDSSKDHETESM